METTSCEVMPAGLSTSNTPPGSVVGVPIGGWFAVFDLSKEILDSGRAGDAFVRPKYDLGRKAQTQRTPDSRAQMSRHTLEPRKRRCALGVRAHDAHEDFRVAKVARHLDTGDGHEPGDAWILRFFGEEGRDFLPDGFGYAVGAPVGATTLIAGHDDLTPATESRACAPLLRCGSTRSRRRP